MSTVRTTLTIDDDLGRALRETARRSGRSFKSVVNEALRRGIAVGEKPAASREPFRVESAPMGFAPGVDPFKLNQLVDELDMDRFLHKMRRDASDS